MELAAEPKHPIPKLSKFVVEKMERKWLMSEIESEEERETERLILVQTLNRLLSEFSSGRR
jgi:hypothetical protein